MKRMMKVTGLLAAVFLLAACDKDERKGSLTVRMQDQPIAYEEVNVEIRRVEVHYEDDNDNAHEGWVTLKTQSGVYNLLELQNGVTTVLVEDEELPVGRVSQMRLILGTNNSVKIDGLSYALQLSSQDETGLKLNLDTRIRPHDKVEILFDFDAEKSIVVEGNGAYKLKPVLHLISVEYDD